MAANVFGTPITDEVLKGMPEYHEKNITRLDRAIVAFGMKNSEGKDVNAQQFVKNVQERYGWNCINCVIYNATGGSVKMVAYRHGDGHLAPSPYPFIIANGQWGAFSHNVPNDTEWKDGSNLVVYAGKNNSGIEYQWMFAMSTKEPGECYTEIRPARHYTWPIKDYDYNVDVHRVNSCIHQAHQWGCSSFASIGGSKSPVFEGIMTLDGAWDWPRVETCGSSTITESSSLDDERIKY